MIEILAKYIRLFVNSVIVKNLQGVQKQITNILNHEVVVTQKFMNGASCQFVNERHFIINSLF